MNWYRDKSPISPVRTAEEAPGYPYYLAIHTEGRLKGQAPMQIRAVPHLRNEWDRGGYGTGRTTREFRGETIRELFDLLQAEHIDPRHEDLDFYEISAPNSPRRGLNRQRVFSMQAEASGEKVLHVSAGQRDDDYNDGDDLLREVVEEAITPPVDQLATTSCESHYVVEGEPVILWIITGGVPALAFEDYSLTERFPVKDEKWSQEYNGEDHKYPHQNLGNIQGPTPDVLPDGKWTMINFVRRNLPIKKLRDKRFSSLPVSGKLHKKMMNRETRGMIDLDISLNKSGLWTNHSFTDTVPKWWREWAAFIKPIQDRQKYDITWDILTETEYGKLVELLRQGMASKAFLYRSWQAGKP